MKSKLFSLLFCLFILFTVKAQDQNETQATYVGTVSSMEHVPSIASQTNLVPARTRPVEMQDGRASRNVVVPGKDPQTQNDYFTRNRDDLFQQIPGRAPSLVFDAAQSSSSPTDPSLAVGPNHVLVVFNTGFRIFEKDGTPITGQLSPNPTIFTNGGCCDLTVSYDNAADRWVLSFLGAGAQIAVSDGPDPVNDGWYVYTINQINDYQKLSVWSDGYYMTDQTGSTNKVYAMERDAMLAGDPGAQIVGFPLPQLATSGFYSAQVLNVSNNNMPAPGNAPVVFFQDDSYPGITEDHLKIWSINVDWVSPGNSTISNPEIIPVTPFISIFDNGDFSNLAQPGGGADIDALQAIIMNQAQFRKFGSYNSALFNFVIDTDATGDELAGIRWYEMRQTADGQPWSIFQEGTYTAPDGKHAWHASMIMDVNGNIGMGYTSMAGPTTPNPTDFRVSSYYTGRFSGDPVNTMTIAEELIAAGTQNIPGLRYGDYSKIDVDPVDDKTFWFINEYMNGGRKDVVGVFKIAPDFNTDVGVVTIDSPVTGTLSNAETVTVTIFNFGIDEASNIPVSYQVDGGAMVNEVFAGPLASATSAQYTFTQTANLNTVGQTYSISATTNLAGDEDTDNDSTTKDVTYLQPNDIGVSSINSPTSGTNLSATEGVSVTVSNYGGASQSNFDVTYDVNGTMVTENVAGPLAANSELDYTFSQTADLSAFGIYTISATTSLAGDSDTSNDDTSVTIQNSNCQPTTDCSFGDGFQLFAVADLSNPSGCEPDGYGDFTNLIANLDQDSTNELTITTGYGDQFVNVWIDFNDDFVFTADELVVNNFVIASGQGQGSFTATTDLVVPVDAALGEHLMRAKSNWDAPVPNDACEETAFGETEDYTVRINTVLGTSENDFNDLELTILETGKNIFDVNLITSQDLGKMVITVHNVLGQRLVYHRLENSGEGYSYPLDLSYISTGVYLVRIGNKTTGKVKRIIVQ